MLECPIASDVVILENISPTVVNTTKCHRLSQGHITFLRFKFYTEYIL